MFIIAIAMFCIAAMFAIAGMCISTPNYGIAILALVVGQIVLMLSAVGH